MSPKPLFLDETPPANLADLIGLRTRELTHIPVAPAPEEPRLFGAWERWRWGLARLQARFQAHPCAGPGCPKCAELYVLAQVLEHRKRQLVATRRAKHLRWLWPRSPQGEA